MNNHTYLIITYSHFTLKIYQLIKIIDQERLDTMIPNIIKTMPSTLCIVRLSLNISTERNKTSTNDRLIKG